ncbi:hypothetical protein TcasGA2_TC002928 [Tribolium castaneum]|uniref:Uncharacterized protein n=1 Tax=Tribolium castaneum TaxID=7070 RepID=D6WHB6_TRICA|nr:hypothetical protein TcasGA2_TC002928 [Tribolium castaneum]
MQLWRSRALHFNFVYHERFQFIKLSPADEINLDVGGHHPRARANIDLERGGDGGSPETAVLNPKQIKACAC